MTALDQFDRLETLGVWHGSADDPGREVVVKFGKSTLVIEESADAPLAHWSLAALRTRPDGADRLRYFVDGAIEESLQIDDPLMRDAIGQIMAARADGPPDGPRRRPGWWLLLPVLMAMAGLVLVLPAGISRVAYALISPEQAARIGAQMLPRLEERTGPECANEAGRQALATLSARLAGDAPMAVSVVELGDKPLMILPGHHVVLNRTTVEAARSDHELAGWIAIGLGEMRPGAGLRALFEDGGRWNTVRFLATGRVGDAAQEQAVNHMLIALDGIGAIDAERTSQILARAEVPASPIVAALRRHGNALPVAGYQGAGSPILSDQAWVALQQICD